MDINNDLTWVPCNPAVIKSEACFCEILAPDELRRVDDTVLIAREGGRNGTSACIERLMGVEAADTLPVIQFD
jgi:hypothetical protein